VYKALDLDLDFSPQGGYWPRFQRIIDGISLYYPKVYVLQGSIYYIFNFLKALRSIAL
jgi:hypothetical protein